MKKKNKWGKEEKERGQVKTREREERGNRIR
jgi:hypothetical protein